MRCSACYYCSCVLRSFKEGSTIDVRVGGDSVPKEDWKEVENVNGTAEVGLWVEDKTIGDDPHP